MAIGATYMEQVRGPGGERWPPRNSVALIDRHGEVVYNYAKVHTCQFSGLEALHTVRAVTLRKPRSPLPRPRPLRVSLSPPHRAPAARLTTISYSLVFFQPCSAPALAHTTRACATSALAHTTRGRGRVVRQAGRRVYVGTLDTRGAGNVTVGSIICFDREQMETARMAVQQGAEVILTPNGAARARAAAGVALWPGQACRPRPRPRLSVLAWHGRGRCSKARHSPPACKRSEGSAPTGRHVAHAGASAS